MTKKTKTRRCAAKARILSTKDSRIVENQKKAEKDLQDLLDKNIKRADAALAAKEKELMAI